METTKIYPTQNLGAFWKDWFAYPSRKTNFMLFHAPASLSMFCGCLGAFHKVCNTNLDYI